MPRRPHPDSLPVNISERIRAIRNEQHPPLDATAPGEPRRSAERLRLSIMTKEQLIELLGRVRELHERKRLAPKLDEPPRSAERPRRPKK
jgi:hypothetical protein